MENQLRGQPRWATEGRRPRRLELLLLRRVLATEVTTEDADDRMTADLPETNRQGTTEAQVGQGVVVDADMTADRTWGRDARSGAMGI